MKQKFQIFFTKQAKKDIQSLSFQHKEKLKKILIEVISQNPNTGKKLLGELEGNFSYRLNIKDRIIYSVDKNKNIIYIKRARTHYGN